MDKIGIAIVGATGMVGRKFIQVLQERRVNADYYLFSSAKSAGSTINLFGKNLTVAELTPSNVSHLRGKIHYALFSAGGSVSKEYAPQFCDIGAIVIDNSSQWRMHDDVPLIVPEVNPDDVIWQDGIIANPNCSTIQAVVALKPLDDAYGLKRVVYSTYQAVSGAGRGGFIDLEQGINGITPKKFPHRIAYNVLPHIDVFLDDGYTKEEKKMIDETRKILHLPNLKVTATTVRVPVFYGHSESINVEFFFPCTIEGLRNALGNFNGLILRDDPRRNVYPMPIDCEDADEVYVGRVRIDDSVPSGANIWVVADNIRKGAATNAVQILELLLKREIRRTI